MDKILHDLNKRANGWEVYITPIWKAAFDATESKAVLRDKCQGI